MDKYLHVDSECGSGGCGAIIPIKKWEECKTCIEKIGFIFGKIIQFIGRRFQDIFSFINRGIKIIKLDKLTNLFFKFLGKARDKIGKALRTALDKIKNAAIWIFNKLIYPIFCNKCTKKIANSTYENFLSPLGKKIQKILNAVFVKFLWQTVICNPLTRKIFCRRPKNNTTEKTNKCVLCKKFKKMVCKTLKSIADWTVIPIWNRIIWPIVIKISNIFGEIFVGAASGICHESEKKEQEEKKEPFISEKV